MLRISLNSIQSRFALLLLLPLFSACATQQHHPTQSDAAISSQDQVEQWKNWEVEQRNKRAETIHRDRQRDQMLHQQYQDHAPR